ncbi:MAG TPA: hypothetical protein VM694_21325, partial [Polyangium sp.]|nr:hypothetical protein [Polyangium sp.]
HLALGDPDGAREHLEKALAAGYSSADLEYALGRAIGEIFRRALAETRRITNEEERKKKVEELERALRDPALGHLRAALAAKIEVPAYAEGLIALYEGKNEAAIAKAKEAFEKAPWMYEAKKLEADALFAEGSKYRHDAASDWDKMKSYFDPAGAAYEVAAEMGRSDPEVHRAACELWEKTGWAAMQKGLPFDTPFGAAEAACNRAIRSSSREGRARVQRALVLTSRGFAHYLRGDVSADMVPPIDDALRAAEESAAANPADVMAHYAVAQAHYTRTELLFALDRDASMAEAIRAYERVLALDPRFTWAVNELGIAYLSEAGNEVMKGNDGSTLLRSAIRQFEQAMAIDPAFTLPTARRLQALRMLIESEIERGHAAEQTLEDLFAAVAHFEKTGASAWAVAYWNARAERLRAHHALAFGGDPRGASGKAVEGIHAFAGQVPKDSWFLEELGECRLLEAMYTFREGLDATPLLAEAQAAARRSAEAGSLRPQLGILTVKIEILSLRVAGKRGSFEPSSYEAALERVRVLLPKASFDPLPHTLGAEIHALRAAWLAANGGKPEEDIQRGLVRIEEALSKNPRLAQAFVVKGMLHLVEARRAHSKTERVAAARRAQEACKTAFRESPPLERDHGSLLQEIEGLLP